MVVQPIADDKVWLRKAMYAEAERMYYEKLAKLRQEPSESTSSQEPQVTPTAVVKNEPTPENETSKRKKKKNAKGASPPLSDNKENKPQPAETVQREKKHENKKPEVKEEVKAAKVEKQETKPQIVAEVKKVSPPKQIAEVKEQEAPVVEEKPAENSNNGPEEKKKKERKRKINKKESRSSQREEKSDYNEISFSLNSLADEVAKARLHIKSSLDCIDDIAVIAKDNMSTNNIVNQTNTRISKLENENQSLKSQVAGLNDIIKKLEARISALELEPKPYLAICPPKPATPQAKESKADDDDDVDLFGSESEEEDESAKKIKEARLAEYAARKSKKPALIAKSNIILDVKPWDDETDMKAMEAEVRKITADGLVWGASKLVPLAYGIHKLQISCVVEDDKVSVDWLTETIEGVGDLVQSVDIAAFNKV